MQRSSRATDPRTRLDASTSPRGAGCVSNPSWLPPHKTKMAAHSLRAREEKMQFSPPVSLSRPCLACSMLLTPHDLLTKKVLRQEQHIGWALCQTPHKIGIPLGAERDVDPYAPAIFHQGLLQVSPDAV